MRLLYGSQNFGYDVEGSDKDWLEFVYPTWDDVMRNVTISKECKNSDGSITKVKDIRLIAKMIEKANFNDLQFLYSQEVEGCEDLKWFFDNRDRLVRCSLYQLYKSNKGFVYSCIKDGSVKSLLRAKLFVHLIRQVCDGEGEFTLRDTYWRNFRLSGIEHSELLEGVMRDVRVLEEDMCDRVFEQDTIILAELKVELERLVKEHLCCG